MIIAGRKMAAQIKPTITNHNPPGYVSSYIANKNRSQNINEIIFKSINLTSSQEEIDLIVSNIRNNNKLFLLTRIIDKIFYNSEKQNARDHLITLTIASAFKNNMVKIKEHLVRNGNTETKIEEAISNLSLLVANSITKDGITQSKSTGFTSVEECAAHALNCLQQSTKPGYLSNFKNLWDVTNTEIKTGVLNPATIKTIKMKATVKLRDEYGYDLKFDIGISDVKKNMFAIGYMASNIEKHLGVRKLSCIESLSEYDKNINEYNDKKINLNEILEKLEELKTQGEDKSIKIKNDIITQINNGSVSVNSDSIVQDMKELDTNACSIEFEEMVLEGARVDLLVYGGKAIRPANSALQYAQDYVAEAKAFHAVGAFLNKNINNPVHSPEYEQFIQLLTTESKLELSALIQELQGPLQDAEALYNEASTKYTNIKKAMSKDKLESDLEKGERISREHSENPYSSYVLDLKSSYMTWREAYQDYSAHEAAVNTQVHKFNEERDKLKETQDIMLNSLQEKFIDHEHSKQSTTPPSERKRGSQSTHIHPIRTQLTNIQQQREGDLLLFLGIYQGKKYNNNKRYVNQVKSKLQELTQQDQLILEKINNAQNQLILTSTTPYHEESHSTNPLVSQDETARRTRWAQVKDGLNKIKDLKQDRDNVIDIRDFISKFENNEQFFCKENEKIDFNVQSSQNDQQQLDLRVSEYYSGKGKSISGAISDKLF